MLHARQRRCSATEVTLLPAEDRVGATHHDLARRVPPRRGERSEGPSSSAVPDRRTSTRAPPRHEAMAAIAPLTRSCRTCAEHGALAAPIAASSKDARANFAVPSTYYVSVVGSTVTGDACPRGADRLALYSGERARMALACAFATSASNLALNDGLVHAARSYDATFSLGRSARACSRRLSTSRPAGDTTSVDL